MARKSDKHLKKLKEKFRKWYFLEEEIDFKIKILRGFHLKLPQEIFWKKNSIMFLKHLDKLMIKVLESSFYLFVFFLTLFILVLFLLYEHLFLIFRISPLPLQKFSRAILFQYQRFKQMFLTTMFQRSSA